MLLRKWSNNAKLHSRISTGSRGAPTSSRSFSMLFMLLWTEGAVDLSMRVGAAVEASSKPAFSSFSSSPRVDDML